MKYTNYKLLIITIIIFTNILLSEELKVLEPNGSEILYVDSITTIKWETTNSELPVTIEFSFDYGVSWKPIIEEFIGNEYEWIVPYIISKNCLIRVYSSSDSKDIIWQKSFGGKNWEHANDIEKTDDGGYVVTGFLSSYGDEITDYKRGSDFWIIKLDTMGNIEWEKSYGGGRDDKARSIHQLPDGGYIVAGYTASIDEYLNYRTDYGNVIWVVRLDKLGNMVWNKIYGTDDIDFSGSIELTNDGGFILSSLFIPEFDINEVYNFSDYYILKIDSNGNKMWDKIYGGGNEDLAYSIIQTKDNGYIVTGYTDNSDVGDLNGSKVIWVLKLFENGELDWERTYGGTNDDLANGILQTSDGGYILIGNSYSRDGDISNYYGSKDVLVIKLFSNGEIDWSKNYGGSNIEIPNSIIETNNGGFIIAGHTQSDDGDVSSPRGAYDAWVFEIDSKGVLKWDRSFGGSGAEDFNSVEIADDGDLVLAGFTNSIDGDVIRKFQNEDMWIVKFNPTKKIFLTDQSDSPFSIKWYDKKEEENITDKFHFTITPNVTSNDVVISLNIEEVVMVTLELFDNIGRRMETILLGNQSIGLQLITLDLSSYSSGRYYLRLITPNMNITRKVELLN